MTERSPRTYVSTSQYLAPHCQCMRAAVASVLQIPIEMTPSECGLEAWDKWAAANNGVIAAIPFSAMNPLKGYTLGLVKLDGAGHAVVLYDGKIVHDPHRDQSGLRCELFEQQMIVPLDPSKRMTFKDAIEIPEAAKYRRWRVTPNQRRTFMRALRKKRAQNRWVARLLRSWAKIDAEENVA